LLRGRRSKKYWQVFSAFFIASFAINVQATSAFFELQTTTLNGIFLAMLSSMALTVIPIIALIRISGNSLASIYLKRGNMRLGLSIGLIVFFLFAAISIQLADLLFQGQNLTFGRIIPWMPWILAIVLSNGLREELLYRGLFLKRFESLIGRHSANLLQALIFSKSHSGRDRRYSIHTIYSGFCSDHIPSRSCIRIYYEEVRQSSWPDLDPCGNRYSYLHRNFLEPSLTSHMILSQNIS